MNKKETAKALAGEVVGSVSLPPYANIQPRKENDIVYGSVGDGIFSTHVSSDNGATWSKIKHGYRHRGLDPIINIGPSQKSRSIDYIDGKEMRMAENIIAQIAQKILKLKVPIREGKIEAKEVDAPCGSFCVVILFSEFFSGEAISFNITENHENLFSHIYETDSFNKNEEYVAEIVDIFIKFIAREG